MPSPVGHSLAGLCGYFLARHRASGKLSKPQLLIGSILLSNLPDFDMVPGLLLFGEPARFHRQASHSFITAVVVGAIVSIIMKRFKVRGRWFGWIAGLYVIHILIDMMVVDPSPPSGVQAFWFFTTEYFILPLQIFASFKYTSVGQGLIRTVFSFHNLMTVLREIAILAPFVLLTWYLTRKARSDSSKAY